MRYEKLICYFNQKNYRKKSLGRPRVRWEDNEMGIEEINGCVSSGGLL